MVGQGASIGLTRLGWFLGVRTGRQRRGRFGRTVNLVGAAGVSAVLLWVLAGTPSPRFRFIDLGS